MWKHCRPEPSETLTITDAIQTRMQAPHASVAGLHREVTQKTHNFHKTKKCDYICVLYICQYVASVCDTHTETQ